jgi:hypothetical protein
MINAAASATSSQPAVCESKGSSPGRLNLRGVRPGKTTVEVLVSGAPLRLPVEVVR